MTNASGIEWADPADRPAGGRERVVTDEILAALRANPQRWACVKRSHSNQNVAYWWAKRYPGFQAKTRSNPDGTFDLYLRYVGDTTTTKENQS